MGAVCSGDGGSYSGTPGTGGIGGGGNGIPEISEAVARTKWNEFAGANGFGGGGGGGNNGFYNGAEGGSGVVILRLSNVDTYNPNPSLAYSGVEHSNFSTKVMATIISVGSSAESDVVKISLQFSDKEDDFSAETFKGKVFEIETSESNVGFDVKDLLPNHTYFFRLSIENDAGYATYSNVFSFVTEGLDEPEFTSDKGWASPGLLQYYHPAVSSWFEFDENSEGLVLMPGVVMAGVGGSNMSVYGGRYLDSNGTAWTFASFKSYGYIGYMFMEAGSTYNFFEHMGDSCRVEIDDVQIINDSGIGWSTTTYGSYECTETGYHKIRVRLGGSNGSAGNCDGGWSFAFGYNKDGDSTCVAKPGSPWVMLENTEKSTFLYPFRPGRNITVDSFAASETNPNALTFNVSLGSTIEATDLLVVYGDTYEAEATNSWDNLTVVGTFAGTENDVSFDVPATARYVRFLSVHSWGVTSWSDTTFIDLSKTSIIDAGVNHGGDQGTFAVRINTTGGGDLTVKLVISTNADMSDATEIVVSGATAPGVYECVQSLNPDTTYYYYYVAETTEGGYDKTSNNSFTTLGVSEFTTTPAISVENRTIVYSGTIDYGAGDTVFTIWGGDSPDSLEPRETFVYSTVGDSFTVKTIFPELPHTVYVKLVASNVGSGGTVWTTESNVASVKTLDKVSYYLKQTSIEGSWDDPNIWTHSTPGDKIVTGYPSNGVASASFRANTDARIYVPGAYSMEKWYFSDAANSTFVFYGESKDVSSLNGDVYGGRLNNTSIVFENITLNERDRFDNGIGQDSTTNASLRFSNAIYNANGGEIINGTNSTFIVENGSTVNIKNSNNSIHLIASGECFVISDSTVNVYKTLKCLEL